MPTQVEIAAYLDLSQPRVSQLIAEMKVDWSNADWDTIRIGYIRHLRAQAANYGGNAQTSLAEQRIQESKAKTALIEIQIAEKAGKLVPVEGFERTLTGLIRAAREELLRLPDKVVAEMKGLHNVRIDPDIIEAHVFEALNRLSQKNLDLDEEPAKPGDQADV